MRKKRQESCGKMSKEFMKFDEYQIVASGYLTYPHKNII